MEAEETIELKDAKQVEFGKLKLVHVSGQACA
jgi:hypothetical protein